MIPSRRVLGACSAVAIGIGGLLAASVARADPPGCHVSDPPSMTVTASGLWWVKDWPTVTASTTVSSQSRSNIKRPLRLTPSH